MWQAPIPQFLWEVPFDLWTGDQIDMSYSDKRPDNVLSQIPAAKMLYEQPLAVHPETWVHSFPEIIGRSSAMCAVLECVAKISRSDSSVLINGESGTGKELIAQAIHRLSSRNHKPFIAINCSAILKTFWKVNSSVTKKVPSLAPFNVTTEFLNAPTVERFS